MVYPQNELLGPEPWTILVHVGCLAEHEAFLHILSSNQSDVAVEVYGRAVGQLVRNRLRDVVGIGRSFAAQESGPKGDSGRFSHPGNRPTTVALVR